MKYISRFSIIMIIIGFIIIIIIISGSGRSSGDLLFSDIIMVNVSFGNMVD